MISERSSLLRSPTTAVREQRSREKRVKPFMLRQNGTTAGSAECGKSAARLLHPRSKHGLTQGEGPSANPLTTNRHLSQQNSWHKYPKKGGSNAALDT